MKGSELAFGIEYDCYFYRGVLSAAKRGHLNAVKWSFAKQKLTTVEMCRAYSQCADCAAKGRQIEVNLKRIVNKRIMYVLA